MTTRQFTGAVNRSKSLSREPCGRGGKCEERGIESGWREGGRKGWGDKWKEEVGRDEGRKGKEGRNNGGRKG